MDFLSPLLREIRGRPVVSEYVQRERFRVGLMTLTAAVESSMRLFDIQLVRPRVVTDSGQRCDAGL